MDEWSSSSANPSGNDAIIIAIVCLKRDAYLVWTESHCQFVVRCMLGRWWVRSLSNKTSRPRTKCVIKKLLVWSLLLQLHQSLSKYVLIPRSNDSRRSNEDCCERVVILLLFPLRNGLRVKYMKDQMALFDDNGRLVALCVRTFQSFLLTRYSRSCITESRYSGQEPSSQTSYNGSEKLYKYCEVKRVSFSITSQKRSS